MVDIEDVELRSVTIRCDRAVDMLKNLIDALNGVYDTSDLFKSVIHEIRHDGKIMLNVWVNLHPQYPGINITRVREYFEIDSYCESDINYTVNKAIICTLRVLIHKTPEDVIKHNNDESVGIIITKERIEEGIEEFKEYKSEENKQ